MNCFLLALIIATTDGNAPADNPTSTAPERANKPSSIQHAPADKNTENLNQAMDNLGEAIKKGEKKKEEKTKRSSKSKSTTEGDKDLANKKLEDAKKKNPPDSVEGETPNADNHSAPNDGVEVAIDSATQIANEAARLALEEAAKLNAIGSSELHQSLQTGKEMVNETVKTVKEVLPLKEEKLASPPPASEPARP